MAKTPIKFQSMVDDMAEGLGGQDKLYDPQVRLMMRSRVMSSVFIQL